MYFKYCCSYVLCVIPGERVVTVIEPSIYKVPQHLRGDDDNAYVPQIVSLGPYHRGKECLRTMDLYKMRALKLFLKRKNEDIKIYLDSIKKLEGKARGCYEGPIHMSSENFVLMMVLDGCFVLELFIVTLEGLEEQLARSGVFKQLDDGTKDPVFRKRVLMNWDLLQRDMIMLENQIPLFILDRLLGLQFGLPEQRGRVAKIAVEVFSTLIPAEESQPRTEGSTAFDPSCDQGLHLLDVLRRSLLHTWPRPLTGSLDHENRAADKRCVTELRDAGIKFEKRDTHRFWDIKFDKNNGILEIPRLVIDDVTKSLFLNLMAFQQCHLDCESKFSSYVVFMDHLINSSKDVRHLRRCGIIEHWLGSDDRVAEFFNRLCQKMDFDIDDSYFTGLSNDVNSYKRQTCHAWIAVADLRDKYFSNLWMTIKVIAGAALLLLTLIQAFYAVYGYHWPKKA